jgi:hypothetical protein
MEKLIFSVFPVPGEVSQGQDKLHLAGQAGR